jgi:glycosyltransferase involved in cell wall biosynthesis
MMGGRAQPTGAPVNATGAGSHVCLFLEGSYPFVFGGVSRWTQSLIQSQGGLSFDVVAIRPAGPSPDWRYPRPPNLHGFHDMALSPGRRGGWRLTSSQEADLAERLCGLVTSGDPAALVNLSEFLGLHAVGHDVAALLDSPSGWATIRRCYLRLTPGASFLQFYWSWRSFFGAVFRMLLAPLPRARVYHAVTTGYAGLMAARAGIETERPVILTEHGIYTNERRIDLMLSDWLTDTLPRAPDGAPVAALPGDIRDFWLAGFESLARICYAVCDEVISLSAAGQAEQLALGADPARLRIIPNGIDPRRFARRKRVADQVPRIAFVGRVVAIKDVVTFLRSVAILAAARPGFEAWVVGPDSEEPDYAARCRDEADRLGLGDVVHFAGVRRMEEVLDAIDVLVLTSTSESLPLVLLEAGAAGVPCVATDVGACPDVILGRPDEDPALGPGGRITRLAAPEATAEAVAELLDDPAERRACGAVLQARVAGAYRQDAVHAAYASLYARHVAQGKKTWQA